MKTCGLLTVAEGLFCTSFLYSVKDIADIAAKRMETKLFAIFSLYIQWFAAAKLLL